LPVAGSPWCSSPLKRGIDIVLSFALIVLLAPLFFMIACIIRVTSPGPVLFRQRRVGLDGAEFTLYKFRSMVTNAEQMRSELEVFNMVRGGAAFKMKDDPRVTEFGRLIRKRSLDELPQLWNVLLGEMSMVGPRPLPASELTRCSGWDPKRFEVKPGLTCLWQIFGRSNISDFSTWSSLDLEYVRRCSLGLDLTILLKTIPVVFSGLGAE